MLAFKVFKIVSANYFLALTFTMGVPRHNVNIFGTTLKPGEKQRVEGKKALTCPESHPYIFNNYQSCCGQKYRDPNSSCGDGAALNEKDPLDCCLGGDYVGCSAGSCKAHAKAFEIQGSWGDWFEWSDWSDCPECGSLKLGRTRERLCLPMNPRTVCSSSEAMETEIRDHCLGGDSCCTSANRCSAGEGDCDVHDQCEEGLVCGIDNCSGNSFQWDDDCCYRP